MVDANNSAMASNVTMSNDTNINTTNNNSNVLNNQSNNFNNQNNVNNAIYYKTNGFVNRPFM